MKRKIVAFLFGLSLLVLYSFSAYHVNNEPWVAPDKFQKLKNPVEADKTSINIGKTLYGQHCKSCHGKEGLGDGPKAAQLETPSGDFSTSAFQKQPDGSIFFKTKEGRGDMPTFAKKIPDDEDVWHLVNYLRTLGE